IIMSAPAHSAIVTNQLPVLAAIVRTPKLAAISFLPVVRNAVAGFDKRIDAFWIRARNCESPLASHVRRQTVLRDLCPGGAFVVRNKETTARPTALPAPRVNHERPHARKQSLWIFRIHHQIRAAGVFIGEEYANPILATICGAKHTALLLRTVRV